MAAPAAKRSVDGSAAIPEDVLLDIFCRLRIKDLFRFAVTSIWWLRLFTDPAFLPGLLPAQGQGHGARLLGFFFQRTMFVRCEMMMKARTMQRASAFAPTFFPTPGSLLGPTERALTSFVADDDGDFNYAEPLAARCGLVLMGLVPKTFGLDAPSSKTGHLFGVCNPVTGERHVVTPMDCDTCRRQCVAGYAIVTAADNSDLNGDHQSRRHVFSQLLIITCPAPAECNNGDLHLHSYSASTRRWSAPTSWCRAPRGMVVSSAAVHQGAAHWLYANLITPMEAREEFYILTVELATTCVSFTKIPAVTVGQTPFLCISKEGRLSITSVFGMHVQVWTRQDGGPTSWLRARLIPIPIAMPDAMVQRQDWYEFNGGVMLVLYRGGDVFVLDLEKKVIEKIMAFPPRLLGTRFVTMVPYEMDLSEFFVSQLGGWLAGGKSHIDAVKELI
ncbi:hypothetical protein EJB05_13005, partial [Eragrostis curvula]